MVQCSLNSKHAARPHDDEEEEEEVEEEEAEEEEEDDEDAPSVNVQPRLRPKATSSVT